MKKMLISALALSLVLSVYIAKELKANCGCGEKKPMSQIVNGREVKYCDPMFAKRHSGYAMSGEEVTDQELLPLFEAGHFAASSYNNQPWRFIVAKRNTPEWNKLFNLLVEFNQSWCNKAGALIVVVSKNSFDWNKPSRTHDFDTGAACGYMALQGSVNNLVVHGMEGFDYDRARKDLDIPEGYTVEAMFAVGKKGTNPHLSEELQQRDANPTQRKPLSEIVFNGTFGAEYKAGN